MSRGNVYTAPKAYIKIDNEVAGYVRNLNFSENVQRVNVQGLGSLTLQEAPAVVYTCQWSVSQYFISFNTPIMQKMLKKFGSIAEIKNSLVLGDIAFDITMYAKTVASEDANSKLVTEVDNTGNTIARLQGCLVNSQSFQLQEGGIAGTDINGIYLEPISTAG
jgi:hypothetical protein